MAITQERMIALIAVAVEKQDIIEQIRIFSGNMISYINSLIPEDEKELREQVQNLSGQLDRLTTPDFHSVRVIETEKAYFSSSRIKYNIYMRDAQKRNRTKKRLRTDPLDLGDQWRQNNEYEFPPQNNAGAKLSDTDEVPLLARLEVEATQFEAEFEINPTQTTQIAPPDVESEEDLKAKFGPDFRPLPPRVGLQRKEPVEQ